MTTVTPTSIIPSHHQYSLPTMRYCLPTMGYRLQTIRYPYHYHPPIRRRSFYWQCHQPREKKRKWMKAISKGFWWTWLRMNLRTEPALPTSQTVVQSLQRPPSKRLVQLLLPQPAMSPVWPQPSLLILKTRAPQNLTGLPIPSVTVAVPTTMILKMKNTWATC